MVRVLIVGAGVTGSLCAYVLRKQLPTKLKCQIVVWEKSRGTGGRMATFRDPQNKSCIAELGAQYIIQMNRYKDAHKIFYDELLDVGVLKPFDEDKVEGIVKRDGTANTYTCTEGLSSISKYFISKSLTDVFYTQKVESLRLTSDESSSDWSVWEVVSDQGRNDHFDIVIVTSPVPQILQFDRIKDYLTEDQHNNLQQANYSSRFAVGLFYNTGKYNLNLPYVARYVNDNEVIRYISIDHAKRGSAEEHGASVIVHTPVPFGIKYLERDKEEVGPIIVKELKKMYPELPEPDFVKYHKWRFSQVTNPVPLTYGCMVVKSRPLLLLAGDGFTHSNFDGCIESAMQVKNEIQKFIENINK